MKFYSISVVIPVYNAAKTLSLLVNQLVDVLPKLANEYEVILINDGSQDESWKLICELNNKYPCTNGINLMRNYGQHNALLCGIRAARNEVIITMDDDLQHPPEESLKLLEKLNEGYGVVYGTPEKEQHGFWRDIASRVTKLALQKAIGVETARNTSAFRAFRTQVREAFTNYQSPFVSIDVMLTWGTKRFASIPVRHEPRQVGESNYTFGKLLTHALNMMTCFSTFPLQLASVIGFTFTLFGLGVLVYVVGRYLIEGGSVPGFTFLASVIAIFSGAQLFALGIFGEYLARIFNRSMEQPTYVISEISRQLPGSDGNE